MKNDILYSVKAQRGPTLRCKGWKQESLLRMLENNLENAAKAHPQARRFIDLRKVFDHAREFDAVVAEVGRLTQRVRSIGSSSGCRTRGTCGRTCRRGWRT